MCILKLKPFVLVHLTEQYATKTLVLEKTKYVLQNISIVFFKTGNSVRYFVWLMNRRLIHPFTQRVAASSLDMP